MLLPRRAPRHGLCFSLVQQALHAGAGIGGDAGDSDGHPQGLGLKVGFRSDTPDQLQRARLSGCQNLVEKDDPTGLGGARDAHQLIGKAEIAGEALFQERSPERRVLGPDDDVPGQSDPETGAICGAVDRGDDDLRRVSDEPRDGMHPRQVRPALSYGLVAVRVHFLDVAARTEGAPGAGQDDRGDVRV